MKLKKKLQNFYHMNPKELIEYFKKRAEEYPLGYNFIEIRKPAKKEIVTSLSNVHNSEKYLGDIIHKEISDGHKYRK